MSSFPQRGSSSLNSIIIAVSAGQFFLPFMLGGVFAMLPAIGEDLQASTMELGLVGAIYTLSLAIFHLIAGRIGDKLGRKKIFLFGFSLLIAMTGLISLAPNMPTLLGMRFIQAAGTGMMNTTALAILVASTPPHMQGRVLSISSIGLYLGVSCGPPIAGLVTTTLGWRWLFRLLVPIAIPAFMLMAFRVREEWYEDREVPFDWTGCFCFAISISLVAIGATWITAGWWAPALLCAGVLGLVCFCFWERHTTHPLIDIRFTLGNRDLRLGLLCNFINFSATFGALFYFSLYGQYIHGLNPRQSGLLLCIQPVMQILLAPTAGRLSDNFGAARTSTIGIALSGMALLLGTQLHMDSSLWWLVCILILNGSGMGLFGAPNTAAIMSSVDAKHLSQASSLVGSIRTTGMMANMVIVSMIMHVYLGYSSVTSTNAPVFVEAMHTNFLVLGSLNAFALVCSLIRLRHTQQR